MVRLFAGRSAQRLWLPHPGRRGFRKSTDLMKESKPAEPRLTARAPAEPMAASKAMRRAASLKRAKHGARQARGDRQRESKWRSAKPHVAKFGAVSEGRR